VDLRGLAGKVVVAAGAAHLAVVPPGGHDSVRQSSQEWPARQQYQRYVAPLPD
jgi:hypothetical protein